VVLFSSALAIRSSERYPRQGGSGTDARPVNLAIRPKPFFKAGNEMFSEAVETLEVLVAKGRTPSLSRHAA
jgi:hypothetical protein